MLITTQIYTYIKTSQLFLQKILFIRLYLDNEKYQQFTQELLSEKNQSMVSVHCTAFVKEILINYKVCLLKIPFP